MIAKNKKRITVTIDEKIAKSLQKSSALRGITKSEFIETVLINATRSYGSKKLINSVLEEKVNQYLEKPVDEYSFMYHTIDDYFTVQCRYYDGGIIKLKISKDGVDIIE